MTKLIRFISLLVIILCGAAFSGCFSSSPVEEDQNFQRLQAVLQTEYPTLDGEQVSISHFDGKIVLLHFFSSWCLECAAEAPSLRNLYQSFQGTDFAIVGIAVDDDPFNTRTFASRHQLSFPILLDTDGSLKHFFSIKDLPVTLFLDRKGVPVTFHDPQTGAATAKLSGARRWDTAKPVEMIASMIEAR